MLVQKSSEAEVLHEKDLVSDRLILLTVKYIYLIHF